MADIDLFYGQSVSFDRLSAFSSSSSLFSGIPTSLALIDPTWLSGHSRVPSMFVSATDDFADLYGLLMRMSLTDNGPSALAMRHALSALASQSVGQIQMAYRNQITAIRALQTAIESKMQPGESFQAMAASMLLNYYETLDAQGSPLSSAIYFCGCKRIALSVHREHTDYEGDMALLLDWILYHDTMYKFSIHHWAKRLPQQQMVGDGPKIMSKPIFSPLRHVVNATIGCSLELLQTICQIVDAVPGDGTMYTEEEVGLDTTARPPERTLRQLELQLDRVQQHVSVVSGGDNDLDYTGDNKEARLEAESRLYHIAAKLYLQRLGRGICHDDQAILALLNEAYRLLVELQTCLRPWPLFVIGVEARNDAERYLILSCMAAQDPSQELPQNIILIKRLIQAAWTQLDLKALETASNTNNMVQVYNSVISANEFPPLFA